MTITKAITADVLETLGHERSVRLAAAVEKLHLGLSSSALLNWAVTAEPGAEFAGHWPYDNDDLGRCTAVVETLESLDGFETEAARARAQHTTFAETVAAAESRRRAAADEHADECAVDDSSDAPRVLTVSMLEAIVDALDEFIDDDDNDDQAPAAEAARAWALAQL